MSLCCEVFGNITLSQRPRKWFLYFSANAREAQGDWGERRRKKEQKEIKINRRGSAAGTAWNQVHENAVKYYFSPLISTRHRAAARDGRPDDAVGSVRVRWGGSPAQGSQQETAPRVRSVEPGSAAQPLPVCRGDAPVRSARTVPPSPPAGTCQRHGETRGKEQRNKMQKRREREGRGKLKEKKIGELKVKKNNRENRGGKKATMHLLLLGLPMPPFPVRAGPRRSTAGGAEGPAAARRAGHGGASPAERRAARPVSAGVVRLRAGSRGACAPLRARRAPIVRQRQSAGSPRGRQSPPGAAR